MARCSTCDKFIAGKPGDAVHHTSKGVFCGACLRGSELAPVAAPKTDGRKAAAARRWASMSVEDRAAHVARMQAGRKK